MADEQQPPVTTTAPPTPSGEAAPAIDRAEYEALLHENQQMRATFAMLDPQSDRIRKLVEDPNAADLFDHALSTFEEYKQQRGPKVSEELTPIYDKVSKLETFVDKYEQQQKELAEKPQREFTARYNDWQNSAANNRFFTRLMADHPELAQRDVQYLAQCAAEKSFEPLEETWKREGWRFVKSGASTPPSSLRTDVGEVGIPGESQRTASPEATMRQRIIDLEKQRRGIA
jgi:hypothetical protein